MNMKSQINPSEILRRIILHSKNKNIKILHQNIRHFGTDVLVSPYFLRYLKCTKFIIIPLVANQIFPIVVLLSAKNNVVPRLNF